MVSAASKVFPLKNSTFVIWFRVSAAVALIWIVAGAVRALAEVVIDTVGRTMPALVGPATVTSPAHPRMAAVSKAKLRTGQNVPNRARPLSPDVILRMKIPPAELSTYRGAKKSEII